MNEVQREFRQRLLAAEPVTTSLQVRYHKELNAMFEQKLSGARRWVWLASAILGLGFTLLFGALAALAPTELPWWGRLWFLGGALFGVGMAFLGLKVFRHGSIDLKSDTTIYNGMIWGFVVFMATLSMVFAPDNLAGLRMILCSLVFLVAGAMFLIRHIVEQSELKTREKLLEIEYRLAELAATLQAGKSAQ
jgi:MFS family permease